MPYRITHSVEGMVAGVPQVVESPAEAVERVVELVKAAHERTGQSWDERWAGWAAADLYIDESGGSVGPLPDDAGVIEVALIEQCRAVGCTSEATAPYGRCESHYEMYLDAAR